jgi:hypothetical protein
MISARLWLKYPATPGALIMGIGESLSPGQFLFGPEVSYSGFFSGQSGYLGISFVSSYVKFRGDRKRIDERIPPLSQRVPQWTTSQLLAQIGHSRRARFLPIEDGPRDAVLIQELLKRDDLTLSAFEDLLPRGVKHIPYMAVPTSIQAAIDAHRVGKFAEAIRRYLQDQARIRHPFNRADSLLTALGAEPEINLEEDAIRFLQDGVAIGGSLRYLQLRGRTAKARDAVASLTTAEWASARAAALASIDQRIGVKK